MKNNFKYSSPPTFIEVVKKNFKLLFMITMVILLVAIVSVFLKKRTYTSAATLLFPSAGGKLALLGGGGGDLPSLPMMEGAMIVPQPGSSNSTAVTLIKSIRAKKMILSKMEKRGYDLKVVFDQQKIGELYKNMDEILKISQGKNNELFITATSKIIKSSDGNKDDKLAFNYMQCVMDTLSDLTLELPLDPAKQGEKYLKDQIAKTTVELEDAANKLKEYQKKYLLIDPTGQAKSLADEYASVKSSAIETKIQADLAMKQLHDVSQKTEKFVKASIDPTITSDTMMSSNNSGGLSVLYQRVTTCESELALLKLKLRDAHPDVVAKRAELNELKSRLKNEMKRQIGLAREGLSPGIYGTAMQAMIAQAKLDGYRSTEVELKKQIEQMPGIALNYMKLQALVTEKTAIMGMLKTEYEKVRIVAETRGPSYIVLDEPEQASEPDSRGGAKTCAIAFVLAMMICLSITYLEWVKYQPEETEI
jgi:uncharacterized protein involved in exopolysaccharide biosynthesis